LKRNNEETERFLCFFVSTDEWVETYLPLRLMFSHWSSTQQNSNKPTNHFKDNVKTKFGDHKPLSLVSYFQN